MSRAARAIVGVVFVLGCVVAAMAASGELARGRPVGYADAVRLHRDLRAVRGGRVDPRKQAAPQSDRLGAAGDGVDVSVSNLPIHATARELQALTAPPLQEAIAWFTEWSLPLMWALFAQLAFLFPTGRLPGGRWRRYAALVLGLIWGWVILSAFWPMLTVQPAGAAGIVEIRTRSVSSAADLGSQPSVAGAVRNRVPAHPDRVDHGDRGSLSEVARPGAPADALARGSVRIDRRRGARRIGDRDLVRIWTPRSRGCLCCWHSGFHRSPRHRCQPKTA